MGIQQEERIGNSQVQWLRQFKYINTQLYISFNHWFIWFFLQLLPISFLHTHFRFIPGCTSQFYDLQQMNFASLLVASWIFLLTEQIEPQVKPELKTALKNCGLHYLGMVWHGILISAWRLVTISFWISGIHIWKISGCWKSICAIVRRTKSFAGTSLTQEFIIQMVTIIPLVSIKVHSAMRVIRFVCYVIGTLCCNYLEKMQCIVGKAYNGRKQASFQA